MASVSFQNERSESIRLVPGDGRGSCVFVLCGKSMDPGPDHDVWPPAGSPAAEPAAGGVSDVLDPIAARCR